MKTILLALAICIASLTADVTYGQTVLSSETFDSSFGIWTSGGGNVTISNTAPYAGANSVRFRGNSGMTLTATGINTSGYDKVDVKFFLRSSFIHASTTHTISVEYRANGSAAWTNVRTYSVGVPSPDTSRGDINAADTYHAFYATLLAPAYSFGATSQFRFVANIGAASRFFYLDNVSIIGTDFVTPTVGPGGITSDLKTWLKADRVNGSGVVANNTTINSWKDSGEGHHANVMDENSSTNFNRPVYKNEAASNINFNPVVNFVNNTDVNNSEYTGLTNRAEMNGTSGFYTQEQFIVIANDEPTTLTGSTSARLIGIYCGQTAPNPWDRDTGGFAFGNFTSRFDNEIINYSLSTTGTPEGYGVAHNSPTASYTNFLGMLNCRNNATSNGLELLLDSRNIVNDVAGTSPLTFANYPNTRYWLGRSQVTHGTFNGRIAEVISYSSRQDNSTERPRIESYLALKYGITLGVNGTTQNYQDSGGTVVWNASANAGYNYNIAGIGRDDASTLNQKQSKSNITSEMLTIGLGDILTTNSANTNTFATDRDFLVWGTNGDDFSLAPSAITYAVGGSITTSTDVVKRKWKVVETGVDVATVKVSIPTASFTASLLPALTATDAYVMVVASNDTFTANVEMIFMTTSGTNQTASYDFDGTKFITFGVAHTVTRFMQANFDGTDDYIKGDNFNELGSAFTIMTWIRPSGTNERVIVSKKANATSGYQLVLQTDNRIRMEWTVAGTPYGLTSNTVIPASIWRNIAVTYRRNTLTIYIDGVFDSSRNITVAPASSTSTFSIGAQYSSKSSIVNFFRGAIDELRFWRQALTQEQIRFIMNQEIIQNGSGTVGAIVPSSITLNEISTLIWTDLTSYYSMNKFIGTHFDDDSANTNRVTLANSTVSAISQTAPLPYQTTANTNWTTGSTWANGSEMYLPASTSIVDGTPITWNIVRTSHNIESGVNKTLLALISTTNTVNVTNDSKLEISHYLKLDGKIDLQGKSQLVQTEGSDLATNSSGSLERDQQGTKNIYNYNYWSSPVSTINTSSNNNGYTVSGVMKDGTTSSFQNIMWTDSYDGEPTTPITLSRNWIYKYQNVANDLANWTYVGENGALGAGQGFTLKGAGAASATQNYTFIGKPNNGLIQIPIAGNNLSLVGNPYPSAISAYEFIRDNITPGNVGSSNVIIGTLYFWEHAASNATHVYGNYQGAYAVRNIVGGLPPVQATGTFGTGGNTREPALYIPVGQAFFVEATPAGGTITFKNSQRGFQRESDADSNIMFRTSNTFTQINSNDIDPIAPDTFKKIRIGFNSNEGFHRQLLLGFMNEFATEGFDNGYDANNFDDNPSDMYFVNDTNKLVIQGVGSFSEYNSYQLGVKNDITGPVKFTLDGIENIEEDQNIFIYDAVTDQYHNIKEQDFEVMLDAGTYEDRFALRFASQALGIENPILSKNIEIVYSNSDELLTIVNNMTNASLQTASIFNILGQQVAHWDVSNQSQPKVEIPINNLSAGTYIVKVSTAKNFLTKKIVIK